MVGPSNMPRRSPWTRRRSSRATSRPSSTSSARVVRSAAAASGAGSSRASTTWGRVGTPTSTDRCRASARRPARRRSAARSRGSRSRPEAGDGQRRGEGGPPHGRPVQGAVALPAVAAQPVAAVSSGLSRTGPPGRRETGHRSPRFAQWPVLPFRIDHPGAAAEHGLAPQIRLDEAALAPADLADHHHVRVGHHAGPVQGERVVDERATQHVPPDEHARRAPGRPRPPAGRRRTDGGWWPRGRAGRAAVGRPSALTQRPRPSGSRHSRATSCWP